ncbi:MAG: hypothetical protein NC313_02345 [Butyrivibrio sp.]|nr:hypothetical protein [Butyrivibrio sp.]
MKPIYRMLWLRRLKKQADRFFLVDHSMKTAYGVGEVKAARWCAVELSLFALLVFLGEKIWWKDFRFIDRLAGIIFPLVAVPFLIFEASLLAEDMPPIKGVKPFSLKHLRHQNELWIIFNQTELSVSSRCDIRSSYLITKDELYHVIPKGVSEQEFIAANPRRCYLVQVTTQQDLEKVFDKVYAEYLENSNDGSHKIVVLNVRMLTIQKELVMPDKYRRQEFIYYAELKRLDDLTYQFLCCVCGDDLGYGLNYSSTNNSDYNSNNSPNYNINNSSNNDLNHNINNSSNSSINYNINNNPNNSLNNNINNSTNYNLTYNLDRNPVYGLDYFKDPNSFRLYIDNDDDSDISIKNSWLKDFYNSACVFQNPSRSVMALMDYWELLLRLQAIYYYQMSETKIISEGELVHANFMTLGKFLVEASTVYPEHQQMLKEKEFEVPYTIHKYLDKLKDYIYIHYSGESVSFLGLISLVQILRNKIVAHGVMNDEIAPIVWGLMYWATILLNKYLFLSNFQLKEAGDTYELGFETTVRAGEFILARDGYPCIAAIQKSNKKKKSYIFVNFFDGRLIAPEYVEVNPE